MTILQSLASFHERLKERGDGHEAPWADVTFSWAIDLSSSGHPSTPLLLGEPGHPGKRLKAPMPVSRSGKKRVSNVLWDNPAYALGLKYVRAKGTKPSGVSLELDQHRCFKERQLAVLSGVADTAAPALKAFLNYWDPKSFLDLNWGLEWLDGGRNIVFTFEGEPIFARENFQTAIAAQYPPSEKTGFCLATGVRSPIARTHTQLSGVAGAQPTGAAIVSFNEDAFESFGHSQGDNAPVSEAAAFAYTSALNWLLSRDTKQPRAIRYRLSHTPKAKAERPSHFRTADATVVFWAEDRPQDAEAARQAAEDLLYDSIEAPYDPEDDLDAEFASSIETALRGLAGGDARRAEALELDPDMRLHVLGLSPNNARLAPRFWITESLGALARHVVQHRDDLALEPPAFKRPPSVGRLLRETALEGKFENVPPRLAGEVMRSVLTGAAYPRTLLAAILSRIRADGRISGARAAIVKAVVNRSLRLAGAPPTQEIPVGLDPDNPNAAYQLGRLFALIEGAQKAALPGLNATVKDRYFAAACATPARVFPLLLKNSINHLSVVRKGGRPALAGWFDGQIGRVWAALSDDLPRALRLEEQGRFVAGYYHQRFAKKADATAEADAVLQNDPADDSTEGSST